MFANAQVIRGPCIAGYYIQNCYIVVLVKFIFKGTVDPLVKLAVATDVNSLSLYEYEVTLT